MIRNESYLERVKRHDTMIKKIMISAIGIAVLPLVTLFTNLTAYEYVENEPFVIASWGPAGPDEDIKMYRRNISIDSEGTLLLYPGKAEQLKVETEAPVIEKQLSQKQVERIQHTIEEQKFWSLPKDLSTPSEDGSYQYITVKQMDQTKKVGVLNTDNRQFQIIHDDITELVNDQEMKQWKKEVEAYLTKKLRRP